MDSFTDIMDYDFTATFEDSLDKVANGDLEWKNVLISMTHSRMI